MIKCLISLVALSVISGCASDRFILIDQKTGEELGPFVYRSSSIIKVEGKKYSIKKIISQNEQTEDVLKSTVLDEFCCEQTTISTAVKQLNYLMKLELSDNKIWENYNISVKLAISKKKVKDLPFITFHYENISAYNILKAIVESTDLTFYIEDDQVWITAPEK